MTVHTMDVSQSAVTLKSHLLSCSRFKGSHTGERISDAFEAVCDDYVIKNKLDYIISDNAANMKRASTVCFPQEGDDAGPSDHLDLLSYVL